MPVAPDKSNDYDRKHHKSAYRTSNNNRSVIERRGLCRRIGSIVVVADL